MHRVWSLTLMVAAVALCLHVLQHGVLRARVGAHECELRVLSEAHRWVCAQEAKQSEVIRVSRHPLLEDISH